ncbi:endoplasmic reticulum metallopeptidase 1 [Trichonephila inaurata madagascariensis]|uniref:FXNA-like protease n=1 Tax=Trichonephila inaurata madagascariensis TaxID=2747483 RepID=A0A8X6XJU4_9ARAC|nr:endoplasmic reticulum metallopeptidase 1 [Trichonephila inaurata madagascariensis]
MNNNVRQRNRPVLSPGISSKNSLFQDEEFGKKKSLPLFRNKIWFWIFSTYFTIFLFVLYCDLVRFPAPVSVDSLKQSEGFSGLRFSEERARNFVVELSSIGPKPTGSYENEVIAVDYILRQLEYIKSHTKPVNKISIDVQKTSGCFNLLMKDGMTSCYRDVKNIIARIGPQTPTNRSIVINCHFDSVPKSPGSSDDLVNCAVMLESLISLSQSDYALPNEVIFLFNGAEENILQAGHGFITQHPWAKTAVGFVNMEACGAGGKQMLFQADREKTWLLLAYANNTPFPQGSVMAQDIFQNGLIPSDTDYRIFDQFGNIPGLDFAYVKNGYVYHTKFDVTEAITEGAIQQAGLNLLNLIHNALVSPDMKKVDEQTKMNLVFFDFMGLFMVVYRVSVATAINALVVVLSLVDMFLKSKRSGMPLRKRILLIGKTFIFLIMSLIGAYVFCASIAVVLDIFNATMSWYRSPYLVAGLYGCSSLAALIFIHSLTTSKDETLREKWVKEDIYFDAARLLWISCLIVLELAKINSSFICCAWALFPLLIRGVLGNFFNLVGPKGSQASHLTIHIFMQLIPLSLLLYCGWSMYTVFIPIMGRIGAMINPDLLVGLFTTVLVFFSTSYMFSLIQVLASPRKVIILLLFIVATTVTLVCVTPLGFPYSGDEQSPAPMRLYILHTERTFYNQNGSVKSRDSGYWTVPLDYKGPKVLDTFIDQIKDVKPVDCDAELACGMPFYIPVISLLRISYYIPASKPKIHGTHKLELVSKTLINSYTYRLSFVASGPDHVNAIISPRKGVSLTKWSLTEEPFRSLDWVDRPTYFLYYSYGEYTEPWTFSIDLTVTKEYVKDSPLIDMSYITHYLHGHDLITGDFPSMLKQIPDWVHVTPWTCTLDMFEF